MEAPSAGSVVLVPFPFSDLSESKLRPAVVLAEISRDDFVLCQVTSNPYADPNAVELTDEEFAEGGLKRVSYARPGKLFTANLLLFERGGSAHGETENRNRRTGRSVAPLRELVSEPCIRHVMLPRLESWIELPSGSNSHQEAYHLSSRLVIMRTLFYGFKPFRKDRPRGVTGSRRSQW